MTQWRKSNHSGNAGGHCVELTRLPDGIGVRDSKAPNAGHLTLPTKALAALLTHAKHDELTP